MTGLIDRLKRVFDPNHWEIKKLQKYVDQVNALEKDIEKLSDEELQAKTPYFKKLLAQGKTTDDIMAEAFAVVREVARRKLGMRPYDVQVLGAVVLHQGRITEMKTGEGKTLTSTMPLYLNALTEKGCHLVTVNDYLAKRDARWMGPVYHFLGLSVGVIQHDVAYKYEPDYIVGDESRDQLKDVSRREAYFADITYGTNNEFGFDYLRDNMVMDLADRVQTGGASLFAADEVLDWKRFIEFFKKDAELPRYILDCIDESAKDYIRELEGVPDAEGKKKIIKALNSILSEREFFRGDIPGMVITAEGQKIRDEGMNDIPIDRVQRFNRILFESFLDNETLQRERILHYAIVDEVDSILIDEARTPLIISGRGKRSSDNYKKFARLAQKLIKNEHYEVHEKEHTVVLTKKGIRKVEDYLGLPRDNDDDEDSSPLYAPNQEALEAKFHIEGALKAKELFKNDVDYVIKEGEIVIVDEFTGRLMFGRRYSDGIHQAIEAKENLKVRSEDQTLASITFQNYFKLYEKLAGMTGTAATEEKEFRKIYNVDVVIVPTNKPVIRDDQPDRIYKTEGTKFKAIVREVEDLNKQNRPILVGTRSIQISEQLSLMLKKKGIKHNVLNAKYHEREAQIIAEAGEPGAVTIATNMAGRGVDIVLGGAPPSDENERRVLKSAKAHLDKISEELDELRAKFETKSKQIKEVESEYDEIRKKLSEAEKNLKRSNTEPQKKEVADLKEKRDKKYEEVKELKTEADDVQRAIKGHVEMLPQLREKTEKAEEDLKKAEEYVKKEKKEWAKRHDTVLKAGGLSIIGSERHESRRIDNQLRGRSGRQGDPGSTRFYNSLEDELMRLFGSEKLPDWLTNWEESEDMPLEHGLFTKSLQKAQEKVESYHFDIRKSVFDYDNVMNQQRKRVYSERDRLLRGDNFKSEIIGYIEHFVEKIIYLFTYMPPMELLNQKYGDWDVTYLMFKEHFSTMIPEDWDYEEMLKTMKEMFKPLPSDATVDELKKIAVREELREKLTEWAVYAYEAREESMGDDLMRFLERWLLLQNLDEKWMFHLEDMDELRNGIGLRAWGQKDPLGEYIKESYDAYKKMMQSIEEDTLNGLFTVQVKGEIERRHEKSATITREHRGEMPEYQDGATSEGGTTVRTGPKIGRNDPCPCGSGKKYKKCCGRKAV